MLCTMCTDTDRQVNERDSFFNLKKLLTEGGMRQKNMVKKLSWHRTRVPEQRKNENRAATEAKY